MVVVIATTIGLGLIAAFGVDKSNSVFGLRSPAGMVLIPGGEFDMGNDQRMSRPNERPLHRVKLAPFWMDRHHVTNAEFRKFVETTGYITTAERKPDWETLKSQLFPGTPKPPDENLVSGAMVFVGTPEPVPLDDWSQWWRFVPGANWRHPQGPESTIDGKDDHPVVQVSYEDAQAYAQWVHKRLPTEAEWEMAARGGLDKASYSWGNERAPDGKRMANTFEGQFPVVKTKTLGVAGTTAVDKFPANGYGLFDMAGNAWQWVADWYRSDAFQLQAKALAAEPGVAIDPRGPVDSYDGETRSAPANAPSRVIRGGSFLCDEEYCSSYRPSARRGNDPYNPMSHIGFRLVISQSDWEKQQSASTTKNAGDDRKMITKNN
ncbi:MAG: formylglycine-generating enzyme family protein [Spongiibacteraceae bacterium]